MCLILIQRKVIVYEKWFSAVTVGTLYYFVFVDIQDHFKI